MSKHAKFSLLESPRYKSKMAAASKVEILRKISISGFGWNIRHGHMEITM